jgi:hypothetical protein
MNCSAFAELKLIDRYHGRFPLTTVFQSSKQSKRTFGCATSQLPVIGMWLVLSTEAWRVSFQTERVVNHQGHPRLAQPGRWSQFSPGDQLSASQSGKLSDTKEAMAPSESALTQRYQQLAEARDEKLIPESAAWARLWSNPTCVRTVLESSQRIIVTLLRIPKRKCEHYICKRTLHGTYWCDYVEPYKRWSCEEPSRSCRSLSGCPQWNLLTSYDTHAGDHPVYGVLSLWETVLCTQNNRRPISGSGDLGEGLSAIGYAACKGSDCMVMSFLCVVVLSRIAKYLAATQDSASSLDFLRLRCQRGQALTIRQWLEQLCSQAKRTGTKEPSVDLDSLSYLLAQSRYSVLAWTASCRTIRAQKSRNITSRRFTLGDLVREVRRMISRSFADAVFLEEQILRATDSLELRVHPEQRVRTATPIRERPTPIRRYHFSRVTTRKQQLAVYECDSDYNQDSLDDSGGAELASDGGDNMTDNFNDGLARKRNAPNVEHLTGSISSENPEVQRAEAAHDEESVEPAPECEYELVVDDITTNSWVVDQFIFDVSEGSLKQEWNLVSNFSAEIDEMSFESATTPEPMPHQTRPSYSQVVRFGQMSAVPESPTLRVIPMTPNKGRPPRKQTRIAGNDDDGNVLLFDAETIRDGSKRADRRRQRLNAKYRRRVTRYYMTSYE